MVFLIDWKLTQRHSPSEPNFLENGLVRKLNGLTALGCILALIQISSRKPFIKCLSGYIWDVR